LKKRLKTDNSLKENFPQNRPISPPRGGFKRRTPDIPTASGLSPAAKRTRAHRQDQNTTKNRNEKS